MSEEKQTYSFSRLTTWETCKHAWKRSYIENDKGENNWFARFGTLGHDIFEKIDRKQIKPEDAHSQWVSRYKEEVLLGEDSHELNWMEKWYTEAENFFKTFKGWRTEPVYIEKHFEIDRGEYIFQGHIDRASQLKNGEYAIQDYKCSNIYEGEKLKEKARQLYLYSMPINSEFKEFPRKLIFFFFRKNSPLVIPFKKEDFREAWEWADRIVAEIESYEGNYPMKDNGFFCEAICNYRNTCTKQFEE